MSFIVEVYLVVAAVLLFLDIIMICVLIIKRLKYDKSLNRSTKDKSFLLDILAERLYDHRNRVQISSYFEMKQSILLDMQKKESIEKFVDLNKLEKKQVRRLKSMFRTVRIEAAVFLGMIGTDNSRVALEK